MFPTLIILAGGKSSRMGQPKGLLTYNDNYWLLAQIEKFIGDTIYIGLGFDTHVYFKAIPWLKSAIHSPQNYKGKKIHVVINPTPDYGLFSTLQHTLKAIKPTKHVAVLPIDVPLLNSKGQQQILDDNNLIVIPKYNKKKGHPVKLNSKFWNSILELPIDAEEARLDVQIKKRNASEISFIETTDASCILNLNMPSDWQEFISN